MRLLCIWPKHSASASRLTNTFSSLLPSFYHSHAGHSIFSQHVHIREDQKNGPCTTHVERDKRLPPFPLHLTSLFYRIINHHTLLVRVWNLCILFFHPIPPNRILIHIKLWFFTIEETALFTIRVICNP
jgi:hypothetical protein